MDRQSSPVKIMFQILQCLHHLVMLQDDAKTAGPRQAFFQKAKELDRSLRSYNFQAIWRVFRPSSENLLNLNKYLESAEVN